MLANKIIQDNARRFILAITAAGFLLGSFGTLASGGDDDEKKRKEYRVHPQTFLRRPVAHKLRIWPRDGGAATEDCQKIYSEHK